MKSNKKMVEFVASYHSVGFANTIEWFKNFLATVSLFTLERKETLNTKKTNQLKLYPTYL